MAEKIRIKKNEIKEIFKNMEYGSSNETTQAAFDWLKTKENSFFAYLGNPTEQPNGTLTELSSAVKKEKLCTIHVPDIDTIKKILVQDSNKKWSDLNPSDRVRILNQISIQIEKKADLFVQLEILTRGILSKDTKNKAISLLSQYFHYYAAFAYISEEEKFPPQGIAVGVISNDNYLAHLGLFLAPALASGHSVVLQIGLQLAPVAFLIQEIAQSAGVPEGTIRIIPSDDGELLPYLNCEKVEIITLFLDLNNETYRGINTQNKKILTLTSYKTPAIIFDSADLDTASESVIESSWSYQSMLPWTTDTILVQENIFPAFLNKLKSKMKTLEISTADIKSTRIPVNLSKTESISELNEIVKQAKLQGIEVFQVDETSNKWSPTLLIGGKVSHNALSTKSDTAKAVTVLAFRSIDEAVNLANNTKQGLWASIWSESNCVINEVTRKLKVSNIFVNGSYALSPEIVFTPFKESGTGSYGGKEGFLEYVSLEPTKNCYCTKKASSSASISNADSLLNTATKAQTSWQKVSKIQKRKIFHDFAENLPQVSETEAKWTAKDVYIALNRFEKTNYSTTISGYNLTSFTEPRGVIILDRSESNNVLLILTSILEGNSLIVLTTGNSMAFLKLLSSKLPSGVLNLVPYDSNLLKKLSANKKVDYYFGDDSEQILRCLPLPDSIKYVNIARCKNVFGKVTAVKNILSDIGSSSNCTF